MASQRWRPVLKIKRILSQRSHLRLQGASSRLRPTSYTSTQQLEKCPPKVLPAVILFGSSKKGDFGDGRNVLCSLAFLSCAFALADDNRNVSELETIRTADQFYGNNEIIKLYEFLSKQKECKNAEVLWRFARAARDYSQLSTTPKHLKKAIIYEGFKAAEEAVHLDENIFACHKWYGIMLSEIGDYEGTKKKIENSYKIRDHFMKAIELNSKDATSHYLLGVWYFTFADLPWYQMKIAATIFASPPACTYDDAQRCFLQAESIDPGFYTANLLMLAKTCLRLGRNDEAKAWLEKLINSPAKTESDRNDIHDGTKLLKSL